MHADHVVKILHDGDCRIIVDKYRRGPRDIVFPVTMRGDISRFEESGK
jgi:hypothetical protein